MMEKDHLVTHRSALDKTHLPTFNEAARGQQGKGEGSQQVEKDKPHPVLEPGNKNVRQEGARLTHEQQMAADHARALGKNAGGDKQQQPADPKSLQEIFWKAKRRAHAMTPFQQAAGSPRKKDRGIERG